MSAADTPDRVFFSMYYDNNPPREGSKFTLLDGITLVADAVAADPFNGDGATTFDTLTRRNLALNPRFANGLAPQTLNNYDEILAGGGGVVTIDDGWLKLEKGDGNYPTAYAVDTRYAEASRWQGKTFTVSATLRLDEPTQGEESGEERRLDFGYVQNGTYNYGKGSSGQAPNVPGEYRLSVVCNVPVDASAWFVRFMGDNSTTSATPTYWTDVVIEEGTSPSEFFDGDSQDNGMFRYEYEGEPGNSTSLEYRVADVLRRNRATNGALHDDEKWWSHSLSPTDSVTVERVEGGPVGDHYRRITLDGVDATSSGGIYYRDSGVSGRGGDVVSVGAWVKQTAGTRFRFSLTARKGGTSVGNVSGEYIDATGDWQWVTTTGMEIADEYDYVQVWVVAYYPTDGFEQSMTGVTIVDGYDAPESFFDSHTPDTYNRLYRKAPDGSSIELETDSQSLYRWTGAEAASESEKYLPAAPEHFDEYSEWLNVEPGGTYQVEAFVKAPGLRSVARRNLTSQGQFATDRRLWGSASLRSGLGATWSDESEFEYGAVRLTGQVSTMFPTPTAYLGTDVKASTLGVTSLAGAEFTLGIDVYSEEDSGVDQKILIKPMDSAGERVGDWIEQTFRSTQEITRQVMRFTLPVGTESFEIRLTNPVATVLFASNVTFEEGATDGSWIEEETGREWLGAENIDAVQLMVEEFDADGESLSVEAVAELGPEDFSNRWRTIAGEYTVGLGAATVRTWVEWVVNGDHPDLQSDWYFGGMKATNVYVVPDRWPGPDSNPDEWREAQYESTTVCLRTPSGHRVFGAMSGLDINAVEGSLDLAEVSFTVTETDYTENPLVIDESDIWDSIVLDPHDDSLTIQSGEIGTQSGWGNIIVNPYSESDA